MKCLNVISLLKQDFVFDKYVRKKLFLVDLEGNGKCNKPTLIFMACFSPKIWLIV